MAQKNALFVVSKEKFKSWEAAERLQSKLGHHKLTLCPLSKRREAWEILYVRRQEEGLRHWVKWGALCPKHGLVVLNPYKLDRQAVAFEEAMREPAPYRRIADIPTVPERKQKRLHLVELGR